MSAIFTTQDQVTASETVVPIYILRPADWTELKGTFENFEQAYAQANKFKASAGQLLRLPNINGDISAILLGTCLLYTSPSPRDATLSRMPSSA